MSGFVKRCVMRRMQWSALLVFGSILLVVLLFVIMGILASRDSLSDILLGSALGAIGGCVVCLPVMLYHPWRFVRMIRRQEEVLGLTFGEEEFTPTAPKASRLNQHYQFSDNWYMCEGSWALHRLYIVKVTPKSTQHNIGRMYYAWVKTIDGRFERLQMESASDQKHFYAWWKAARK